MDVEEQLSAAIWSVIVNCEAVLLVGMFLGCGGCLFAGCTRKVFERDWQNGHRYFSLCCALVDIIMLSDERKPAAAM